jgi:ribosomal protein L29
MKKNAIKELREKSVEAMKQELSDKQRQVFALRTQGVTQKIENPHQSMSTRHDITRSTASTSTAAPFCTSTTKRARRTTATR